MNPTNDLETKAAAANGIADRMAATPPRVERVAQSVSHYGFNFRLPDSSADRHPRLWCEINTDALRELKGGAVKLPWIRYKDRASA